MKTRFFELARKSSKKSLHKQHKIGAVLVKKNRILSIGFNKPLKTHPLSTASYQTVHAELDAILNANKKDVEGATIYVYREDFYGNIKIAKPCEHCERLLKLFKIKEVCFTVNNGLEAYRNYYD